MEVAYCNIPVHPKDRFLVGLKWPGQLFVDLMIPFSLHSAPFIFDLVASLVEWIIGHNYNVPDVADYFDDFILPDPPASPICAQYLSTALEVCKHLGLPLHPKECEGLSTSLVVLGIHLDSVTQTARLPSDKLESLRQLIESCVSQRWCNRQQLESLIEHLHHAVKVVWPGRTFMRHMIDLLRCFWRKDHPIRLNKELQLDGDINSSCSGMW